MLDWNLATFPNDLLTWLSQLEPLTCFLPFCMFMQWIDGFFLLICPHLGSTGFYILPTPVAYCFASFLAQLQHQDFHSFHNVNHTVTVLNLHNNSSTHRCFLWEKMFAPWAEFCSCMPAIIWAIPEHVSGMLNWSGVHLLWKPEGFNRWIKASQEWQVLSWWSLGWSQAKDWDFVLNNFFIFFLYSID